MKNTKTITVKSITLTAVFIALIAIFTMISITLPYGYFNLGDGMIYTCAWAIGGIFGAIAAGIGSAIADMALGYPIYAPATLVIKFAMGLVCYLIMRATKKKQLGNLVAMLVSAAILVVGYVGYEYFLTGKGGAMGAIPGNLLQGAAGVVLGFVLINILSRIKGISFVELWKAEKDNE